MDKLGVSLSFLLVVAILSIPIVNAGGTLACSVGGAGTKVLGLSNTSNAHSELQNYTNYANHIKCADTGPASLSITSTAGNGQVFLRLNNYTNSHSEINTESDYDWPAYIGASSGTLSIAYRTQCKTLEVCIATIPSNSDSNLHVADCLTDPYSTKVCARLDYDEGVTCNADEQCLSGVCDLSLSQCIQPTIKTLGTVIFWENNTPISGATVFAELIRDRAVIDTKTTTTDFEGDYEIAFDIRGRSGNTYIVNTTITKGSFETYVTREFLVR